MDLSQATKIGDLLSNNERARMVVPAFQRGYSWAKKNVDAFWSDITQFHDESQHKDGPKAYFLGPIVIRRVSPQEIELLDGQQRLATATILLAAIRGQARAIGTPSSNDFARDIQREMIEKGDTEYALRMGETDNQYFHDTIQCAPPRRTKPTLKSHRHIRQAMSLLSASLATVLDSMTPPSKLRYLKDLYQIVRSDLVMASIPVDSEREAFKIFETLNDRGLRLSAPDLLLNYMMSKANALDRAQIRALWTEMLEQMGSRPIDRFLRHLWVSKYGDLKSTDLFSALSERIATDHATTLEFAEACATECEAYVSILDHSEEDLGAAAKPIRSLVKLNVLSARPVLLSAYVRFGAGPELEKISRWLLVFITRYSLLANWDASGMETILFQVARSLRDPLSKDDSLKSVKNVLWNNAPSDEHIRGLGSSVLLSSEQAKYILKRLADWMQTKTKEVTIDEANLEHIFPKNPHKDGWGGTEGQEALEPLLWNLGNMTLLGERLNNKIGNEDFSVKLPFYAKSEVEMSKRLENFDSWGVDQITSRSTELLKDAVKIWNFENVSRT